MSGIVIVDDQSINRKVLSRLAGSLELGLRVKAFADPLDAIDYSGDHTPDLLVTDFKMPKLNGAELISRFRMLPDCLTVPAIVVTAYEDVEFRSLALQAGANEFVISPLNHDEFCAQSRKLLSMRHTEQLLKMSHSQSARANDVLKEVGRPQVEMYNRLIENVSQSLLHRVEELTRINAELGNLLELHATPAIFVDENLNVRRFTSQIATIYAATAADIGSPLSHLPCMLADSDIVSDVQHAIHIGETTERYLEHKALRSHYLLKIIPNLSENRCPLGAMLTFTQVSAPLASLLSSLAIH